MKLNKTMGRVATTLVATAMLASVAVVPAFADTVYGTTGSDQAVELTSFKLKKTLVLPKDVDVPAKDFTFDIVPVKNGELGTIKTGTDMNTTYDVKYGIGDTLDNAGTASVTGSEVETESDIVTGAMQVTVNADFTKLPSNFSEPGIYKYQIVEDNAGDAYYDETKALDLYVMVQRGDFDHSSATEDTCAVTGVIVYGANATPDNKNNKKDTYVNYYRLDEDGKDEVGDVTVKKTVTGAMGSKAEMFTFTVTGLTAGTDYTYYIGDVKQSEPLTSNDNTFQIHDGQTVKIVGIEDDKQLTIKETDGKTNIGYSLTNVTVNGNDWTADNKTEDSTGVNIIVDKDVDQNTVFTNTRDAVSPTGIVMNVAPYALLVVVAAAGCFVFMRKRRED